MLYDLSKDWQREEFRTRATQLLEGRHVVELTRKAPQRTLQQNAYLAICIRAWALYYGCNEDYSKTHFFKQEANLQLFAERKTAKDGSEYFQFRSTRDLTTEEMSLAIDRFRDWCAQHGCYIPAAGEREALVYIQGEIEKNKEFL